MPPRNRKPSRAAGAVEASAFPTWDDLVSEAHSSADMPPYQLALPPLADGKPRHLTIEVPDGARYIDLIRAQRRGDAPGMIEALFPDAQDRVQFTLASRGADWTIVDVVVTKVLRYFYGLDTYVEKRDDAGNPDSEGSAEDVAEEAASEVGKSSGS